MSFGFDDPPTVHGIKGWSYIAPETTSLADVNLGMGTLFQCVNLLFEAKEAGEIFFRPGVTARMLEMVGILLLRAAHAGENERVEAFKSWAENGPRQVNQLIEDVKGRPDKYLTGDDFAMFMSCPPGGYTI